MSKKVTPIEWACIHAVFAIGVSEMSKKITPIEYARKMIEAYAGPDWKFERAYWERKLEERLAEKVNKKE
jgi:hypothetical protein